MAKADILFKIYQEVRIEVKVRTIGTCVGKKERKIKEEKI
jgi:hypothetical protein